MYPMSMTQLFNVCPNFQLIISKTILHLNFVMPDYILKRKLCKIPQGRTSPTSNNLAICFLYFSTLHASSTTVILCKIRIMQNAQRKFLQTKPPYTNLEKTNWGLCENLITGRPGGQYKNFLHYILN